MTEKRYKAIPETVEYKDTVTGEFLSPKFEKGFYKVLDLLNENEVLKERNQELYDKLQVTMSRNSLNMGGMELIKKENEELKQFKEKVFSLFDKEIARNEEAIEWGKETGADSGSMGFYNHMLKRLIKELEE